VYRCLETLNDPTKSGPPRLPDETLSQIYTTLRNEHARPEADEFEILSTLAPILSEAIFHAKLEARNMVNENDELMEGEEDYDDEYYEDEGECEDETNCGTDTLLYRFCTEINSILVAGNGEQLAEYLPIEPPYPPAYDDLVEEVMKDYPWEWVPWDKNDPLDERLAELLPEAGEDEAGSWTSMVKFISAWLSFLQIVDLTDLVDVYEALCALFE
jgi:hypothetical protein